MQQKIGMITVGQSPRDDIAPAMSRILGAGIEIVQEGALDGLSDTEIKGLMPEAAEVRLCTRLADGRQVVVVKEKILSRVQDRIDDLNQASVDLIVLLCTGHFPRFESRCLVVEAQKIVDKSLEALVDDRYSLGIVVPLVEQMDQAQQSLSHLTPKIHVAVASPYGPLEAVQEAAAELYQKQVDLVVLHCMGFSSDHRQVMRAVAQKPVLVANSIVARTVAELLAG
jgi:protein AroM